MVFSSFFSLYIYIKLVLKLMFLVYLFTNAFHSTFYLGNKFWVFHIWPLKRFFFFLALYSVCLVRKLRIENFETESERHLLFNSKALCFLETLLGVHKLLLFWFSSFFFLVTKQISVPILVIQSIISRKFQFFDS